MKTAPLALATALAHMVFPVPVTSHVFVAFSEEFILGTMQ
jgi:hypothetical protein